MPLSALIKSFPLSSGVYLMKNAGGEIIYVGKAVSLRHRVQSYFRKSGIDPKTARLVTDIVDISYISAQSEAEALILEASLVKKHQPKYNIDLRDDKSYPFIEITADEFPRVRIVRPREKNIVVTPHQPIAGTGRCGVSACGHRRKPQYFGPYVEPRLIREALTIIRKIFHFCTCDPFPKKPCLDYHIGLCDAPCAGEISRKDYRRNIRHISQILDGRRDELYRDLKAEMESLAKQKKFEQAAKVRDQMQAIGALYSGSADVNYFKEAEQLSRALALVKPPERIEAFDISHTMGGQSVGSMVTFLNGRPAKDFYRRFRIKTVEGIDDFAMIAEVVRRRYTRVKEEGLIFPDLILIDGGKGQLAAAQTELKKLEMEIPVISLAKREEEVFVPRRRNSILLPKDSLGLKLLQRVRDEAHRFAIKYHRGLRSKSFLKSRS